MIKLWMAPGGLHIEPGRTADAGELARIHASGFYRGWPAAEFASFLSEPGTPVYVACDARRRIAGFALIRIAADESELLTIAVDPKWRGKRVGEALLRAVFDDLLMSPARRMFLEAISQGSWDGEAVFFATQDEAYDYLLGELRDGDRVLVKSSNSAGLRHLGDRLGESFS